MMQHAGTGLHACVSRCLLKSYLACGVPMCYKVALAARHSVLFLGLDHMSESSKLHRSVDSPSGGDSQPSPFRQWYQGQEPWWAKDEEEQTQNAQSEIGESEADTDIGSTSADGLHHARSGRGRYYYLLVIQLTFTCVWAVSNAECCMQPHVISIYTSGCCCVKSCTGTAQSGQQAKLLSRCSSC